MAIDFPNSPILNQIFSIGDKAWYWSGTRWEIVVVNPSNLSGKQDVVPGVSSTEISNLDGSTSNIQQQIDSGLILSIMGAI